MDTKLQDPIVARGSGDWALKHEVEEFLYREADILDERRFDLWLDLLAEDILYFMPVRRNVKFGQHAARENTRAGEGISWFDEGKWTLTKRVEQILTGVHYAEEPLSRICRLVTNVRVLGTTKDTDGHETLSVRSHFLLYQNRVEYETYFFAGKRNDILRRVDGDFQIARREIILDQNVLLAKNLTAFF